MRQNQRTYVKSFYVEVIHTNKYITNKIKSCNKKIKTDFHEEVLPPKQTSYLTVLKYLLILSMKIIKLLSSITIRRA